MLGYFRVSLAAISLLLFASPSRAQPQPERPFEKAIEIAQARTVKIYGAGIGREPGYGSGVLISADGQILAATGTYLLAENIRVTLPSGESTTAKIVKQNESMQLALLKIEKETPAFFEVEKSAIGEPGDWILAVSNCFKVAEGDEPLSVGLGVISARTRLDLKRGVNEFNYPEEVLLFDAITSNPGSQGGAMVTADGKLAGMVGKVLESRLTGTRLNYAVPCDVLHKFLTGEEAPAEVVQTPPMPRGDIGIRFLGLGVNRDPAYVDRVVSNSPAAQAGIMPDDLIVSVNGEPMRTASEAKKFLPTTPKAEPLRLVIKRKDKLLEITIPAVQ
jgi:S1-C subfamily serine protease